MKIMFKNLLIAVIIFLNYSNIIAQNDTTKIQDDLLSSLSNDSTATPELLPQHMFPTQRILWGKKGLMRNINYFKLTPEERDKELKIRRVMLVSHQIIGSLTSLGMIAQGIVGAKLYNGDRSVKDFHEGLAAGVDIGYFTTASLSLFAPPRMLSERKGFSSIKAHKYLAILHLTSMIATNILADGAEHSEQIRKWHRAAAFTAFGSFLAAEIVIKF